MPQYIVSLVIDANDLQDAKDYAAVIADYPGTQVFEVREAGPFALALIRDLREEC